MTAKENTIDTKFLKENPKLQNVFFRNNISTYGEIIDRGFKKLEMTSGISTVSLERIHNHLKEKGFGEGLPGYRKKKYLY